MTQSDTTRKSNETAKKALECTRRIYDLAAIAWRQMSEDTRELIGLKKRTAVWSSADTNFLRRYGQLGEAERVVLKRYCYTAWAGTKARPLEDSTVPFILFSIATRRFSHNPAVIYGILRDIDWQGNKLELEPFMYEISERRNPGPLEVSGVTVKSRKGTATVEFDSLPLFEINTDTIGDITNRVVGWFETQLSGMER